MTRNEKEKRSFVYRSAVKHIFKPFTDNLLRRSSLWKSRGIIASLENGKSSAKCIPSPPPPFDTVHMQTTMQFVWICSIQTAAPCTHWNYTATVNVYVCIYRIPEVQRDGRVWDRFTPADSSYPKKGKAKHRERIHMFGASGR